MGKGDLELSIGESQAYQLRMLKIVTEVCESNNIPYLLHSGNMLGAVRHGGMIPWCTDTDILVPEHMMDKFFEHAKEALAPDFWIDYHKVDKKSNREFARIGITGYDTRICHLDVFRLVGLPDDPKDREKMYKEARSIYRLLSIKRKNRRHSTRSTLVLYACKPFAFFVPYKYLLKRFDELCNRYPYEKSTYAGYLSSRNGIKSTLRREEFDDYVVVKYDGLDVRINRNYHDYLTQLYGDYMKMPPEQEREKIINRTYTVRRRR